MRLAGERGVRSFEIYKDMAKAYYMTGKFKLADHYLKRALQLDSKDWELYFIKAETAELLGDSLSTYVNYEQAYDLHPSDTVFNRMFDYAMEQENMKRAARYISKDYIRHPGSPDLLYRAGNYFSRSGRLDTTFYLYHKVMVMEPGRVRSYDGLASSFYDQARYDSALFYVGRALEIDSTALDSHLIRARTLAKKYYYGDARKEYLYIIEMDSTHTIARDELKKLDRKVAYLRSLKKYEKRKEDVKMIKPLKPKVLN
jgi:tetratricopeptide (TPR) repeat protein